MENPDDRKYLNEARARAEYLATAKKRFEDAPIEELFTLIRKGSSQIAMLASEEISNRLESRPTPVAADKKACRADHAKLQAMRLAPKYCPECGEQLSCR